MDDTERIRALEAQVAELQRERTLLRAAIEASPAGILVASAPDGVIQVWNAAALGIRGADASTLTEIPIEAHPSRWQTFHPDGTLYEPDTLPMSRALLHGEVVVGDDVVIRNEEGEERLVSGHAAPIRDEAGEIMAAVVVFPDITERRRAEQEVERFRGIAEVSPDYVGMARPDGRAFYVNPAGLRLCGLPDDIDVSTLRIPDFHPPDVAARVLSEGVRTAIAEGMWRTETELCGPDGERIPVSQVLLSHRDPAGKVTFLSTVMRDLRPLRALEAQLVQSQKLEAVGRLAGGIAHDFNNLLTVIANYTDMTRDDLGPGHPGHEELGHVLDASNRATSLCQQLLSFARRQVIAPTVLDLNAAIAGATELLDRLLEAHVQLDLVLGEGLGHVRLDPAQVDQILVNLAVNARDAMPSGGRLVIETANVELDEDYARTRAEVQPGHYVMLAVSDTGEGIPEEVRSKIFEPFFTTKAAGQGSGLGLATVHGTVRQQGGHIWVYSEVGRGTTFRLYFPRVDAPVEPPPATTQDILRSPAGRQRVLVVEDDPALRDLTARMLKDAGYEVLASGRPSDAIAQLGDPTVEVDVLLTDVVMPEMTGKALADRLLARRPSLRVLYVSGYAENTIVHHGVLDDGVAFLAKPFSREQLLDRLARVLRDD